MTAGGYTRLEEELKHLKVTERPAVIKAIEEARAHGDLSENAEYHAAKEKQGFIEGRVQELEDKIGRAEVIDPSQLDGSKIKFGATVCIADEDTDEESTYQTRVTSNPASCPFHHRWPVRLSARKSAIRSASKPLAVPVATKS